MIDFSKASLIGEGEWVKDSAYQVYELYGKYYAVIVCGRNDKQLMEETAEEIPIEKIGDYIYRKDWLLL